MGLVIAACMILIAAFLLRSEWEKLQLDKTFIRLRTSKPLGYPPDKAGTDEKLRLLFISDLHEYAPAMHRLENLMAEIRRQAPDAVIVGGDMLTVDKHRKKQLPVTKTALSFLKALAAEYPVYCGEGNHELRLQNRNRQFYENYTDQLRQCGIRLLSNQSEDLSIQGVRTGVRIHGVSLGEEFYQPDPGIGLHLSLPEGYLERALPDYEPGSYNILLLHEPAFLKESAAFGADLVLSGHMHGGTIRFPDGSGLMTPQYRLFVRECSGIFREGQTVMAVSRGLGTHSIKIRFNDLPELMYLDLAYDADNGSKSTEL